MIVVDAMVVAYFLVRLPGFTEDVDRVFETDPSVCAPALWRSELRNTLLQYVRSGAKSALGANLGLSDALALMRDAEALLAGRTFDVKSEEVLRLADASGCTAYDGEYVALARELDVPLLTYDQAVRRAFPETARHPRDVS